MENSDKTYKNFKIPTNKDYEEVFSHFYFAENNTDSILSKTLLPSYQTILIFNFGTSFLLQSEKATQIKIDKCLVLGPIKKAFNYSLPPKSKILVVNFKNDAFYRFFSHVNFIKDSFINPDDLLKKIASQHYGTNSIRSAM